MLEFEPLLEPRKPPSSSNPAPQFRKWGIVDVQNDTRYAPIVVLSQFAGQFVFPLIPLGSIEESCIIYGIIRGSEQSSRVESSIESFFLGKKCVCTGAGDEKLKAMTNSRGADNWNK